MKSQPMLLQEGELLGGLPTPLATTDSLRLVRHRDDGFGDGRIFCIGRQVFSRTSGRS
jgi:hypothetical protein